MTFSANPLFYKTGKGEVREDITATGTIAAGKLVTYAGAAAGAGAVVRGVAQFDVVSGDTLTLVTQAQETAVLAGGAFSIGDAIVSDASGKAVVATTGKYVFGRAIEASTGDGKYALIEIRPEGLLTIPA
jgi:hypothetical protein